MFEHRHQPLISHRRFVRRLLRSGALVGLLVVLSMLIGMVGYHYIVGLRWVDAFLNASMILSGMGEIDPLTTNAGKIFAGVYALFSGIAFLTSATILMVPVVHRVMHHFHWEAKSRGRKRKAHDSKDSD